MRHNIMDYSLLVGVRFSTIQASEHCDDFAGVTEGHRPSHFVVGTTYYFGVIDILQRWTVGKRLERFAKTKLLGQDLKGVSATEPEFYQRRFVKSVVDTVFVEAPVSRLSSTGAPRTQRSLQEAALGAVSALHGASETEAASAAACAV
jgi:hypothetical protein